MVGNDVRDRDQDQDQDVLSVHDPRAVQLRLVELLLNAAGSRGYADLSIVLERGEDPKLVVGGRAFVPAATAPVWVGRDVWAQRWAAPGKKTEWWYMHSPKLEPLGRCRDLLAVAAEIDRLVGGNAELATIFGGRWRLAWLRLRMGWLHMPVSSRTRRQRSA